MAEIVNLRRVRKRKQKDERTRQAGENRVLHGLSRHEKELTRSRNDKAEREIAAGHIEAGNKNPTDMQ